MTPKDIFKYASLPSVCRDGIKKKKIWISRLQLTFWNLPVRKTDLTSVVTSQIVLGS